MSTEIWVDCNVHLERLPGPYREVLDRAQQASVRCVATGTDPRQWQWLAAIEGVHKAFGVHPQAQDVPADWLDQLHHHLIEHPHAAVGEIGLDFRAGYPEADVQLAVCRAQLDLAVRLERPVILHAVKAHHALLPLLAASGLSRFMVHAFNGTKEVAEAYLELGGFLSAGGMMTWNPPPKGLDVLSKIPLHRLLLETDAPDLPVEGRESGEPSDVSAIGAALAAARGLSVQALARQTRLNAEALFGVDFAQ